MSQDRTPATPRQTSLSDEEILSGKRINRRSLLASTGISVAVGVSALIAAGTTPANADNHRVDYRDRAPSPDPKSNDAD
jgi:hypothetical protein